MRKLAILTTTGKFKRTDGMEVEKTPEALVKALANLQKKGKIALLQDGLPKGELGNFKLALIADGDNLPDAKLSINYKAEGLEVGDEQTQESIDIDSAYITKDPLNEFSKVLKDSKDGGENTSEKEDLGKLKAELETLQKEREAFLKEREAFKPISEEHKAMKAEIESKLDSEIKERMPEKPPKELSDILSGKDKKEQVKLLKLYRSIPAPVKAGVIVPQPDNSNEGEKPLTQYKYKFDK